VLGLNVMMTLDLYNQAVTRSIKVITVSLIVRKRVASMQGRSMTSPFSGSRCSISLK
jgi:hypothetical protein